MKTYRLRLLGPIHVEQNYEGQEPAEGEIGDNTKGASPRFRSRRTRALLGYLVTEQRAVARDRLVALFWPDWSVSRGRANLRRDLYNLAQILPGCWKLNRHSVSFAPSHNVTMDVYRLEQLVTSEKWGLAADLLRGDFLEGLSLENNREFENWLLAERARWQRVSEKVLRKVVESYVQRGQYADALIHSRKLLQLAPWDEAAHQQIMRLLAWTGQRGSALRQFEKCRKALKQELDIEPTSETVVLYKQIQEGQLRLPPQLPTFFSEESPRHGFERPPFVGREEELTRLDTFIDAALSGQGKMVFVTGGPGRGKTALLEALSARAMEKHRGLLVASGKCNAFAGTGDPYLPFRDVMAMLTGELESKWDAGTITRDHARRLWASFPFAVQVLLDHGPHLLDVLVPSSALLSRSMVAGEAIAPLLPRLKEMASLKATRLEELEQSQLFQQVTDVLHLISHKHPLLLILDDIQWADAASIGLLFHLGRRLANKASKLLIVCAYRPEEVIQDPAGKRHPLAKVLSEFRRTFGEVWLRLEHTAESKDRKFVDSIIDVEPNRLGASFRSAFYERTGGHPLFTVETLRAMKERGKLLRDENGAWMESPDLDWMALPARVEAVIAERIDQLEPELRDILTIASVEGELFTAQVIAKVGKIPERVALQQLSQLLERQQRLVREQEEVFTSQRRLSRYRFTHILFQDYLYRRLGRGEQKLLHAEVAVAIEKLYEGYLDQMVVNLAHHYHLAGESGSAIRYYGRAGERAARLFESEEAIKHFSQAIQLAEDFSPDSRSLARLHRGRGLAYGTTGHFEQALADLELTLHLAGVSEDQEFAWRTTLDLGRLWASRDHLRARTFFEASLDLARQQDNSPLLATSFNWMGNWYSNNEDYSRAVAYHQQALAISEDLRDAKSLANTLDLLGMANLLAGDLAASVHHYDRAIRYSRELQDRPRLASSLLGSANTVSASAWLVSVPVAATRDPLADIEEALQIARELGLASESMWARYSLGLLNTVQGEFGSALENLKVGLRHATEIDHREWVIGIRFALGFLYGELFAVEEALKHLEVGLDMAEQYRSPLWAHFMSGALAGACLQLGDHGRAQACLEKSFTPGMPMDTVAKRYCWARRAELALAEGDSPLALDITERLIDATPGTSPERAIVFLWWLKGEALAGAGCIAEACSLLYSAMQHAQISGQRFLLWRILAGLGKLHYGTGNLHEAEDTYAAAQSLIDGMAATIPDETLKGRFLHGAYGYLGTRPIDNTGR